MAGTVSPVPEPGTNPPSAKANAAVIAAVAAAPAPVSIGHGAAEKLAIMFAPARDAAAICWVLSAAIAVAAAADALAVAVTQGILQICTWSELRGVLAHEISHVRNRDILTSSVAASIAMGITFLARMAAWSSLFMGGLGGAGGGRRNNDENIFGFLAMIILAPLAATILQLALSRSREYEADRDGARLIGDGEPLASALAKLDATSRRVPMNVPREMAALYIVNPLAGRRVSFAKWFSDHPPTDQRIARLRSHEWAHRF